MQHTPQATSKPHAQPHPRLHLALMGLISAACVLMSAHGVRAEDTVTTHAYSYFNTPKYGPDFTHLAYVNPDAPKGGEIIIASERGTFDSFNPYARKGVPGALASMNFERLLTGTADEIGTSYGLLAESIEYPEDQSWVIFTLHPKARFADGSDVKASDVVFTHNLFMEQGLISYREGVSRIIKGVEALDEDRVKFTFTDESPVRERIEQAGASIVMSEAWYKETGARLDESRLEQALGTGPYVLDSFKVNERIIYKLNPDYWGKDLPINKGRWNFDTIRVEYFADSNAAFEGFTGGAYTFRVESSSKQWATSYDFPAIDDGHVIKTELEDGSQASGQAYVFNMRHEKFQDIRVREAIGLMFNFKWSNEALFYGLYERVNSFTENSYLEATGEPSAEERALLEPLADLLPDGALGEAIMAPTSGKRQFDRKNARKASALLDDAGWAVGDDGMRRNAQGQTLDIEFLTYSPTFDRVITPYVENLRKIGVDAKLNRVDTSQFVDRRYAFDYDIITDSLALGYEPGGNLEQRFGSKEAAVSVFNSPGVSDPAVDSLIETIRNAHTKEELVVGVKALDRVLRALRFTVPQWYKDKYTVAYYNQFEHPDPLPPYDLGYLDFWWVNADKAAALKSSGVLR
ncbi:extracellular solute-binding protein [Aliiroseovarius lamellibrachiae]|uniref:extracellular solute-binding protein n=1 Tax=Aliiroseovarius lamellibrachiae TaxID=1924933 RepID=UPI001BDFDAED|nr:extracellular solute-binding protein [Aliiroseovarius lamellibrachiae]MBT2130261.1 extracellular solute-binding protein [Aliiroseovarius lamellibrachiae]